MTNTSSPDLILHRGLFVTLDRANPTASAVAIKDGRFTHVGREQDIIPLAGPGTRIRAQQDSRDCMGSAVLRLGVPYAEHGLGMAGSEPGAGQG